jgi:ABC-type methionine transport system ATPase subunit
LAVVKKFITLTYEGDLIKEPIIYEVARQFEVVTNIFRANVDAERGWVVLEIEGSPGEIEKAMAYLQRRGVRPEETREKDLLP